MSLILKKFYDIFDYNPSTLSGCLDVIVVQKKDGSLQCSPFHVRVGKFKAFNTKLKKLQIHINGIDSKNYMILNKNGIGYFETELSHFITSETEPENSSACFQSDEESKSEPMLPIVLEPNTLNNSTICSPTSLEIPKPKSSEIENSPDFLITNKSQKVVRKLSDFKINDDIQLQNKPNSSQSLLPSNPNNDLLGDVQISLCGNLLHEQMSANEINFCFDQYLIPFAKFDNQPLEILQNDKLMFRINSKIYDSYYGIPQLISKVVYRQELSPYSLSNLKQNLVKVEEPKNTVLNHISKPKTETRLGKSLKPSPEFLKSIKLNEGINLLQYRFKGNLNYENTLEARLFFYPFKPKYKLIVSDIDGTITKSDILGHLMPFIYRDWSQKGIAEFYQNLANNGYTIIYLTARNIGQASKTLNYLKSVNQNGICLPEGPLITSPGTLYESLQREVLIKNPEVFKIRVLRQLKKLFNGTVDYNPLFCGFGNKDTDAIAYAVVGMSKKRIFTINPDGDIFLLKSGVVTSYLQLNQNLNQVFPLLEKNDTISEESDTTSKGEFGDKNYDAQF